MIQIKQQLFCKFGQSASRWLRNTFTSTLTILTLIKLSKRTVKCILHGALC
jgi:hypothetical protein